MAIKKLPVIIQLYPEEVHKADLLRELRIDKHDLDRELLKQPGAYAWWAALYSEAAAKVELLQEKLERLEARLFIRYLKRMKSRGNAKYVPAGNINKLVVLNPKYIALRAKVRQWKDAERVLKYSAVRGFEQRKDVIQSYCANQRREQDSEPKTKRRPEED